MHSMILQLERLLAVGVEEDITQMKIIEEYGVEVHTAEEGALPNPTEEMQWMPQDTVVAVAEQE